MNLAGVLAQEMQSEQSSLTHNIGPGGPNQCNPYSKSMKMQPQLGLTSKTFSGSKVNPNAIFGSPEKLSRKMQSKIPTMTLQSREDLYEQNMHTKMQINNLRNENRKINTKLLVLEN